MGVPLNHPFIDGFSITNHPDSGVPPFMETLNRILIGFSTTNQPFWGTPMYGNPQF